ncbi:MULTISPECIES: hypothetical protein [Geobacter]|uniref:Glycoside hydrolase family 13 N-terminal domain-containing protein n=1 Tax=Geobacter soli TaxID=1510391 RepID=A0A0C1QM81_9BACT|nr:MULTISPECIES: hypothetical protein [Geobacter]ANA39917.1 hypothetical protein A2G06_05705 [Geobacter anodireducens]KIE41742.1 hypothetical protein SE37_03410 [Geobacter soli]HMN02753.1 hypothetical protein [Geobacter anodireducens]
MAQWRLDIGATPVAGRGHFRVWNPHVDSVEVIRYADGEDASYPLSRVVDPDAFAPYFTDRYRSPGDIPSTSTDPAATECATA